MSTAAKVAADVTTDGTSVIGFGDSTGHPPCRCEGCQKNGVLRIDH